MRARSCGAARESAEDVCLFVFALGMEMVICAVMKYSEEKEDLVAYSRRNPFRKPRWMVLMAQCSAEGERGQAVENSRRIHHT